MNRRMPRRTRPGQLPQTPFELAAELSRYYDTPAEPNNVHPEEEIPVVLHEALLKILVCPVDKGCLLYFADENLLYNPRLRRAYRIEGGIPVMLADRAVPVQELEHERLLMRARDGAAGLSAAGHASRLSPAGEPGDVSSGLGEPHSRWR